MSNVSLFWLGYNRHTDHHALLTNIKIKTEVTPEVSRPSPNPAKDTTTPIDDASKPPATIVSPKEPANETVRNELVSTTKSTTPIQEQAQNIAQNIEKPVRKRKKPKKKKPSKGSIPHGFDKRIDICNVSNDATEGALSVEEFNRAVEEACNLLSNNQATVCSFNCRSLRKFVTHLSAPVFFATIYDVLCLQEIQGDFQSLQRCQEVWSRLSGYKYGFWNQCTVPGKKGYSGTAIFTLKRPKSVKFGIDGYDDSEGRVITVRFKDYTVINIYHQSIGPSSGLEKRQKLDPIIYTHILSEQAKQPVAVCADLNVPLSEFTDISEKQPWGKIDFTAPRQNLQDFLKESKLADKGAQDSIFTWYHNPTKKYQNLNQGMRVDFILTPPGMRTSQLSTLSQIFGSDHKPICLTLFGTELPPPETRAKRASSICNQRP